MIPSLEGWATKAKEAPSPHEVKQTSLDTNPVFQCLGSSVITNDITMTTIEKYIISAVNSTKVKSKEQMNPPSLSIY